MTDCLLINTFLVFFFFVGKDQRPAINDVMTTIVIISNGPTPICVDLYMKNSPHVAILTFLSSKWDIFFRKIKTAKIV